MWKRRHRYDMRGQSSSSMSPTTRGFLQKICYRRAASVDMTQHGFITDSKVNPVNLLLKPLRERLEKICGSVSEESLSRAQSSDISFDLNVDRLDKYLLGPSIQKTKKRSSNHVKKRPQGYYVCKNLNRIDSKMIICDVPSKEKRKKRAVTANQKELTNKCKPPALRKRTSFRVPIKTQASVKSAAKKQTSFKIPAKKRASFKIPLKDKAALRKQKTASAK